MPAPNVVLLTNFIPPYRLPVFHALEQELGSFRVLESVPMEPERPWVARHGGLHVETQKTLTLRRRRRHPYGFSNDIHVHFPYDTLGRLSRFKPDVILSGELGARTAQSLMYKLFHPHCRLIIWATLSEHTEQGRGVLRHLIRTVLFRAADAVLVNGASGARYVKRFGVPRERIFLAPQSTDHLRFPLLPLGRNSEDRRRLLYVGRLIELKGLATFLSNLSRWCAAHSNTGVELWLVGDGPERAKLERIGHPHNLRLQFWGNVAFDELPAFYAKASILVFPTLADEWGLVVNEAMASGMPVLGSVYSQAVEELVKDGVTGWTFRPNYAGEMYAALDRALTTSPECLAQMGTAARWAIEHLTPEFAAGRILDAIRFVHRERQKNMTPVAEISRNSE